MAGGTALYFDLIARDKASKVFKDIGKESEQASSKMDKFHKVGKAAGYALAGGLALAGAAAVKFTQKAAEDQQSTSRLAQTLQKATGATKAQRAEVERWITAQGKAKGVADDDLRPALSKLAVATGSVTKAQKLASLAMDVSQGTGKSLESVSFALAKAQNGNVAGLARLGVQTTKTTGDTLGLQKAQTAAKQAQLNYTKAVKEHGKHSAEASIALDKFHQAEEGIGAAREKTKKTTLSLDQITKNLAKTYGGAAAKNAQTAAGKQKILQVQISELQEKIGYALIPVMSKLATIGLKVVDWIDRNTKVAGILVAALGGLLAVTWGVSAATKAWTAATTLANVATKAWAAGQWLLNAALDANPIGIAVIAIAALVAGIVIAYKKSATFRAIVSGAFHAVGGTAKAVFGAITKAATWAFDFIKSHWKLIASILGGPIVAAVIVITSNWGKIKAGAANVFGFIKGVFGKMLGILLAPFKAYLRFMGNLPGAIRSVFSGAIGWLASVGSDIVQGLWNGISGKWNSMMSWLSNKIAGLSHAAKKLLGIASPSKVFHQIGQFVVDGLVTGIQSKWAPLKDVLSKVVDAVKAAGDKLKSVISARNSFASGFQSFASSAFGADFGTDESGNPNPVTVNGILAYQKSQAAQAKTVNRDVHRLVKLGLSPALIKQLQAAGPSGLAEIQALAGATPAQIRQYNALNKQTTSQLHSAGMVAGNAIYGAQIHEARQHYREEKHLLREIRDELKRGKKGEELVARIDGGDLIIAIRHTQRKKGQKPTV